KGACIRHLPYTVNSLGVIDKVRIWSSTFVLSLALVAVATSATAGTILIIDSPEGVLTAVGSGGAVFEFSSCSVTTTERCFLNITGPANTQAVFDFSSVNMFEPGG